MMNIDFENLFIFRPFSTFTTRQLKILIETEEGKTFHSWHDIWKYDDSLKSQVNESL